MVAFVWRNCLVFYLLQRSRKPHLHVCGLSPEEFFISFFVQCPVKRNYAVRRAKIHVLRVLSHELFLVFLGRIQNNLLYHESYTTKFQDVAFTQLIPNFARLFFRRGWPNRPPKVLLIRFIAILAVDKVRLPVFSLVVNPKSPVFVDNVG